MCRKSTLFVVIFIALQVVLLGNAFAAEIWWKGGTDNLFTTGANWWYTVAPGWADNAHLDQQGGGPIYCTVNPACSVDSNTGAVMCVELYVGDYEQDPTTGDRTVTLDVNQQTLDVNNLIIGTRETIWWTVDGKAVGDVNVYNGGIINVKGDLWVGSEGIGYLNVRDGDVNITGTLRCPGGPQPPYTGQQYQFPATGRMILSGGTVEANDIYSYPEHGDIGQMDIAGGTLILNGDKTLNIADLMSQGRLYAYNHDGDILCDYDVRNALKTTVTSTLDPNRASNPNPANYAQNIELDANLSWTAASSAASHDVYFGTSFSDVNDANHSSPPGIFKKNQAATTFDPCALTPEQTYYWRIDEVNSTTYKGNVWRFTVKNPYIASAPNPVKNAFNIPADTILSWTKGIAANSHDVYLGTSFSDVNTATTPTVTRTEPNYAPGNLLFGQTYYWRVDEVNTIKADPNTWKGTVWKFSTRAYKIIDNFDTYSTTPGNRLQDAWKVAGGATISLWTDPPANDFNAMKVGYSNSSSPWYSEANYPLPLSSQNNKRNWSLGGVKILEISFCGAGLPLNDVEQLYVAVQDANNHRVTVSYPDSNDIVQEPNENWHYWSIDLERFSDGGVNLLDVRQLTIGFGNRQSGSGSRSGTVYFDNIRLYRPMCLNQNGDADLNNDCDVNMADLRILASDWLDSSYQVTATPDSNTGLVIWYKFDEKSGYDVYDSSGNNNTGSLNLDYWDATGHDGNGAVNFVAEEGMYLDVPRNAGPTDVNLGGKSTVAFWIKDNGQGAGKTIFQIGSRSGRGNVQVWSGQTGNYTYRCGEDPCTLYYDQVFWGRDGYTNPEHILGQWNHYAFTKDYTTGIMKIYHNGKAVAEYKEADANSMPAFRTSGDELDYFTIGAWHYSGATGGYYNGIMDDFRLYKRALSGAEILYLYLGGAGSITQPVLSQANVVADNQVNFKDFAIMADLWLETPLLWPY